MIKIDNIIGTMKIDLETGIITDNSLIDCFGGGGSGKGAPKPPPPQPQIIYRESPESIAYRKAEEKREKERKAEEAKRKAEEDKIKTDAASRKAEWESREGMGALSKSGQFKAPAQKDVGLMAEAARQMEKGSKAEPANNSQKKVTSDQTLRGGDTSGDIAAGLGNVAEEDDSGMFFKKKKKK